MLRPQGHPAMYSSSTVVKGTDQTSAAEVALQKQKFEEIVGVLLSAGYFRARIASLTPFDKVCVLMPSLWPAPVPSSPHPARRPHRWWAACAGVSPPSAQRWTWTCSTMRT